MNKIKTQTLGYPRIGPNREIKRALEAYWKGDTDADTLLKTLHEIEAHGWKSQLEAGIDFIGVGDSTLYDHVLDWVVRFDLVPDRFRDLEGLDRYFAMARGVEGVPALELTKWFDTNYHYLVPELGPDSEPQLNADDFLDTVERARSALGDRAVPIVLGPVTLVRLSRVEGDPSALLEKLGPIYAELLSELKALGVPEVQLHEPAVVLDDGPELEPLFRSVYPLLDEVGLPINLVTYFDDPGPAFPLLTDLPVQTLSLDFSRGRARELLDEHGWPDNTVLGAGVVDGRNVWRMDAEETLDELRALQEFGNLRVSASSSLQFVPYTVRSEPELPEQLTGVLAFAEEKLEELGLLAATLSGEDTSRRLDELQERWVVFRRFAPKDLELAQEIAGLDDDDFHRAAPYEKRRSNQVQLPQFPTTTIGSFPQTREIRRLRAQYRRGDITEEEYKHQIDAWIAYTIGVQEGLGLDVLVHGEFERSDMVEYFAQKLTGFAFTRNGWVQSYGSRYVRPPIIYADVTRPEPMTVREFRVAQSFTDKPVKGMLTGPVTILNWSFPRLDISRREIAFQLGLALRKEIEDLQQAGARVIQVDEPALREGLPFKSDRWHEYLSWAVDAFRLATAGAAPATQIHTHMCYAEFGDVLPAIDRLNADVISIENARSDDETLRELSEYEYGREVGPGVYDVHSPVVPDQDHVAQKLRSFRKHLAPERIWVNPDCGLKTRGWEEVIPSLQNLVQAAENLRQEEV
ncbi:MAG: 5-methyltetrahydropteroyltriglutamate--homocysteine S-methyltransferase [Anaerolineales bacterium]|nr:5-methyltetrahydropteroyltriglutamate--homocysteine S-methyltransferase [Anaerolineales bacterium]